MAENCAYRVAARSGISLEDAQHIVEQVADFRDQIAPTVESSQLATELDNFARQAGEDLELAAKMARREKLDNIMKASAFEQEVLGDMIANAQRYDRAFAETLHKIADSAKGIEGMYVAPYVQAFKNDPLLFRLLKRDVSFQEEVIRARHELGAGKTPPNGHDKKAWDFAKLVNENEERFREALNRQGAQIGKLDGYGGRHKHNSSKIGKNLAAHDQMLRDTLDFDKSFPWLEELELTGREEAITDIIRNIQSHILKGKDIGEGINPNDYVRGRRKRWRTSSGMEHNRVMIFKDAEAWIKYNRRFGEDTVLGSIYETAQRSAEKLAVMRKLGTRPEATISSLIDKRVSQLRDPAAGLDKKLLKELSGLTKTNLEAGDGVIARTWKVVSGQDRAPVNITGARIAGTIRNITSMAKLGGALLSSFSDVPIGAMHMKVKFGYSVMDAWGMNLRSWFSRVPPELRQEFAGLIDAFGDGFKGYLGARLDGDMNVNGVLSRAAERFFTFSGLTGWTDNGKAGAVQMVSRALGDNAKLKWGELPPNMQRTLRHYGLDKHWDIIREHMTFTHRNGGRSDVYIVPERAAKIPDKVIDDLISDRIEMARKAAADQGFDPTPTIEKLRQKARDQIDMDVHSFFAAEVDEIVLTPDSRTRVVQTLGGTRPGTWTGELSRSVMQFKGFPVAFIQKVFMPMIMGKADRLLSLQDAGGRIANTALMMAQLTAFGYVSMEAKRVARGEKPYFATENPDWRKAALASFVQGGGAGIYGDFLLAETNRFGGGMVESLAGPGFGMIGDIDRLRGLWVAGDLKGADIFNTLVNNTPYINLWYTRALFDYSFMYSAREALSPGWMKRRERNMKRDGGREYIFPPSKYAARPFG